MATTNGKLDCNETSPYICSAISSLKKYVREQMTIINKIHYTPASAQQKAEAEAMINQVDLAIRRFEASIKSLDNKIKASLNSLIVQPQRFVQESVAFISCPFCIRKCNSRNVLNRHIIEDHHKHNEIYEQISSLTPEFMLASDVTFGGTRHCFYCQAPFRSNAPLFRHIQEAHVKYFDIFVKVSICKGDKMPTAKPPAITPSSSSSIAGRGNIISSSNARKCVRTSPSAGGGSSVQIPLKSAISISETPVVNHNIANKLLKQSTKSSHVHTVPHVGSISATITSVTQVNPNMVVVPMPQNARKSVKAVSTIASFVPPVATSLITNMATSVQVKPGPSTIRQEVSLNKESKNIIENKNSSTGTSSVQNDQVQKDNLHSARKRRIIIGDPPGPASKKLQRNQGVPCGE